MRGTVWTGVQGCWTDVQEGGGGSGDVNLDKERDFNGMGEMDPEARGWHGPGNRAG